MKYISAILLVFEVFWPSLYAQNAIPLGKNRFFDSMYILAHTANDTQRVWSYTNMGEVIYEQDVELAKRFCDTAEIIDKRTPTILGKNRIYHVRGMIAELLGRYEEAYKLYSESANLAILLGAYLRVSFLQTSLGAILYEMGRVNEAIGYYQMAIESSLIAEQKPNLKLGETPQKISALRGSSYKQLAKLYMENNYDDALIEKTLSDAINYSLKYDSTAATDSWMLQIEYYIKKRDFIKAEEAYNNVEKCQLKWLTYTKIITWDTDVLYFKSLLQKEKGLLTDAKKNLKQVVVEYEKKQNINKLRNAYMNLAEIYHRLNQDNEAYAAQSKFIFYNDSLRKKSEFLTINNLEAQYQNQKKQAEINQKNAVQKWLIGGILGLIALLGFIFYQNRSIKTKNALLAQQADQLATMMKEIHHRVKNNLEVINSLLNMQSFQSLDPSVKETLKEGQSRIKSMALIHNKLYQNDNLAKIDFQEYATELATSIISTFKIKKEIDLAVQAKGITLDIDTAVPLGLILNELITNSMKYAYDDVEKGLLNISISQLKDKEYTLRVSDNGKGLSPDFDIQKAKSLGLRLVQSLTKQLSGVLNIEKPLNTEGVVFNIQFRETI